MMLWFPWKTTPAGLDSIGMQSVKLGPERTVLSLTVCVQDVNLARMQRSTHAGGSPIVAWINLNIADTNPAFN